MTYNVHPKNRYSTFPTTKRPKESRQSPTIRNFRLGSPELINPKDRRGVLLIPRIRVVIHTRRPPARAAPPQGCFGTRDR